MPVYLVHGFRWPRAAIRIHIILNNVEDAAAEYIMSPTTSAALMNNLRDLYPELMTALPNLRFIEQYDPEDTSDSAVSQPFAFVADKIESCKLSLDVGEVIGKGVGAEGWGALVELRDHLAAGEKVGWWVVYNGDEQRMRLDEGQGHELGTHSEEHDQKKSKGGLKQLLRKGR
ncbi:hypothetical protein MMC24_004862 [Lignoscripta atroalba]|nr:hypothetical protein [Lignoscripta atroalba]